MKKIDLDKLYWDMDADTDSAILKGIDAVPVVEESTMQSEG